MKDFIIMEIERLIESETGLQIELKNWVKKNRGNSNIKSVNEEIESSVTRQIDLNNAILWLKNKNHERKPK